MEPNRPYGSDPSRGRQLTVLLLGPPRILANGRLVAIDRQKAIALLAFLAVTGVEHRRDMLAEMLWPEFDRSRARAALRRALASLTRAIPGKWWEIDREMLCFRLDPANVYLDVREFRHGLRGLKTHTHKARVICQECLDTLTQAVQLYQGDFMEGFTLGDCPEFDDWQRDQGEDLRHDLAYAVGQLVRYHAEREEHETAIRYGKRWVRTDPLDDQPRLALMRLYLQTGQRNASLREFEEYARLLQAELGVPPEGEIARLHQSIKGDHRTVMTPSSAELESAQGTAAERTRRVRPLAPSKADRMVGREAELELAEAAWRRVLQGDPAVLVISGEPGIGKSHLVRKLKQKVLLEGAKTLEGDCYPDGGQPYACFSQVAFEAIGRLRAEGGLTDLPRSVFADLASLAPQVLAMYPDTPANPRLDPQSEEQRNFDSFFLFCETALRIWRAPLLLVLEDVHWADPGSLRLLRHLLNRARVSRLRLLVVVTLRDTEIDLETGSASRELLAELRSNGISEPCPLQPLHLEQTRDLMRLISEENDQLVQGLAGAVQHQTEGNPFFVKELCRTLIEEVKLRERFEAGESVVGIKIPASIREVILARVKRLSATAQNVLQQAALLGRQFDAGMLSRLCDLDDDILLKALEECERAHIINETSTPEGHGLGFTHILIPNALRESMSALRRKREHQRIAESLEVQAPEDTSALAYHYAAAENRPKAIKYAQMAARKAVALNAYEDALKQLRTALGLFKKGTASEVRLSILEDYGDVYRLCGEGAQAVAIYQEAEDVWRSLPQRERWTGVRLRRKVGETVTSMNQHADVLRLGPVSRAGLEAGLALVKDEPPHPEKVRLLAALSRDAWYMRSHIDWEAAESFAIRAVETAEAFGQPVEVSVALQALAAVYGLKGKLRERAELCRRRLELSFDPRFIDLRERVDIYLQTGMALYDVGEYVSALGHLREAESLGHQIRDIPKQADTLVRQGQCLFRMDRWDDLLAIKTVIRRLQSRFTQKRMGVLTCSFYAIQSAVCTWRGETGLGEQLKAEAHDVMQSIAGSEQDWLRNQHF